MDSNDDDDDGINQEALFEFGCLRRELAEMFSPDDAPAVRAQKFFECETRVRAAGISRRLWTAYVFDVLLNRPDWDAPIVKGLEWTGLPFIVIAPIYAGQCIHYYRPEADHYVVD